MSAASAGAFRNPKQTLYEARNALRKDAIAGDEPGPCPARAAVNCPPAAARCTMLSPIAPALVMGKVSRGTCCWRACVGRMLHVLHAVSHTFSRMERSFPLSPACRDLQRDYKPSTFLTRAEWAGRGVAASCVIVIPGRSGDDRVA